MVCLEIKLEVLIKTSKVNLLAYQRSTLKSSDFELVSLNITHMWDGSARIKKIYFILHNSMPEKYKYWLKHIKDNYPWEEMPEPFLFINAWNEWAEGNHMEPCQKWGTAYLDVTNEIL